MKIELTVNDAKVRRAFARAPEEMRKAMRKALVRAGAMLAKAMKENLIGSRWGRGPITTTGGAGILGAIGFQLDPALNRVTVGAIKNAKQSGSAQGPRNYAYFIEYGRKPGKGPPPGALKLFVRRKLGIGDPKAANRAAFAVSRYIARHGVGARPFIRTAVKETMHKIERVFRDEVKAAARKVLA